MASVFPANLAKGRTVPSGVVSASTLLAFPATISNFFQPPDSWKQRYGTSCSGLGCFEDAVSRMSVTHGRPWTVKIYLYGLHILVKESYSRFITAIINFEFFFFFFLDKFDRIRIDAKSIQF